MNSKKCALGLVAMLAAVAGLTACDKVTANNSGSIFTYTDASGARKSYTAEMLMNDYRKTGSSFATDFDKVYEVLVRDYYNSDSQKTKLATMKSLAQGDVLADKQTAKTNATSTSSYEAEFEKILTNNKCENVNDLFEYHLYTREKEAFQEAIYENWATGKATVNGLEALKDGFYTDNNTDTKVMQASADYGIGNDGWLKEQMPYHYRHILIKLASGKTGEFTQDKIGESTDSGKGGETTNLANLVIALAGGSYTAKAVAGTKIPQTTISTAVSRRTFGELAAQYSDDNTGDEASSTHLGETSIVTKVMDSDFVPEFKLGSYAYETLYNTREIATDYGKANAYRITPGLKKDAADYVDLTKGAVNDNMVDATQKIVDKDGKETTVYQSLKDEGIGTIPFGAAVALADYSKIQSDDKNATVNGGNEAFYPRNVIFNKYFNKHNICVITPNAIWSNKNSTDTATVTAATALAETANNTDGSISNQHYVGTYVDEYGKLPGFSIDTKQIVDVKDESNNAENVLTNSEGQVVLAVRVSSSGYQGIHFIVVQRSALSQYGLSYDSTAKAYTENSAAVDGVPTQSQYYTTYIPGSTNYPTSSSKANLQTYVNYNTTLSKTLTTRSNKITSALKSYNSNLSTYQFQMLIESGKITFTDKATEAEMKAYISEKRQSTVDTAYTNWTNNWKTYAELIQQQEAARAFGSATGKGSLLSETTAVDYVTPDKDTTTPGSIWAIGGACYGTK